MIAQFLHNAISSVTSSCACLPATESITTTSTADDLTSWSTTSRAISPESGYKNKHYVRSRNSGRAYMNWNRECYRKQMFWADIQCMYISRHDTVLRSCYTKRKNNAPQHTTLHCDAMSSNTAEDQSSAAVHTSRPKSPKILYIRTWQTRRSSTFTPKFLA